MKKNSDILNKLQSETTNTEVVHLWLEGMFWKAYERSAYIFSQHVGDYKPYKRWIKAVGGEIVAIGFPAKAFAKLTQGRKIEQVNEKHCIISGFTIDRQEWKQFQEWKKNIASFPYSMIKPKEENDTETEPEVASHSVKQNQEENTILKKRLEKAEAIVGELRRFRMESATPLQAMIFLANLIAKTEDI